MQRNHSTILKSPITLPAELFNPLNRCVALSDPGEISTYTINNKTNPLHFFSNPPTAYLVQPIIESQTAIAIPLRAKKNKNEILEEEDEYCVITPFSNFLNYHFQHHCLSYYFLMKESNEGIQNLKIKVRALNKEYENKNTSEALEKRDAINQFLNLINDNQLEQLLGFFEEKGEIYQKMIKPRETGWKKGKSDTHTYLDAIEQEIPELKKYFDTVTSKNRDFFTQYFNQEKENRLELKY